jgi:hypothetical protein
MRMLATDASDGITIRGTAAPFPMPIATSPTATTADGAVCARRNCPRTLGTSGRRRRCLAPPGAPGYLPTLALAGARGISARIGPEVPAQASCLLTLAPATDQADVVPQANFRRMSAPTGRVPDGRLDRRVRRVGFLQEAASGADGAAPRQLRVTGEALSREAAPGRLVSSAIEAPRAWAAAASEEAVASGVVAAVAAVEAGGGGDPPGKTGETKEHNDAA